MKPLFALAILFFWSIANCLSQNHLPNPGFEIYDLCPDSSQVNGYLQGWQSTNIFDSEQSRAAKFFHRCDPMHQNMPEHSRLGNGQIGIVGAFLPDQSVYLPGFIYTELESPLDKDTLYYFEYTSASNSWRFENIDFPDLPRDNWCISPHLGYSFTTVPPIVDTINPLEPLAVTQRFAYKFGAHIVRFGQCFKATGEEKYFVFGQFFGDVDEKFCFFDQNSQQHLQFGEVLDNFIVKKLEPELCCDTFVCLQEEIDFSNAIGDYALPAFRDDSFKWSDGVVGKRRTFEESGTYFVDIEMACGSKRTNSIYVEVDACVNQFALPNAFSPNGDGINDFFRPFFGDLYGITSYELLVFNRWGAQVYISNNADDPGWDGTFRGEKLQSGIYIWSLSYETSIGAQQKSAVQSGDVLLLR